jgi:Tub family
MVKLSESTRNVLSDAEQISWRSTTSYDRASKSTGRAAGLVPSPRTIATLAEGERDDGENGTTPSTGGEYRLAVERLHQPRSGSSFFAETVIRRSGTVYTMYLQTVTKAHPLYVGEKHGPTYAFRSVLNSGEDPSAIVRGSLCKRPPGAGSDGGDGKANHNAAVTYALTRHHHHHHEPGSEKRTTTKVAYIDYEIPTVYQVLTETTPRRARVSIFGRACLETKEPNNHPSSKEGGQHRGGHHLSLDFHGRGREASRKNIQLVDDGPSVGGGGRVVLQMAKWEKDQFHVDFSYPFDAFHAFGFALAQFDL